MSRNAALPREVITRIDEWCNMDAKIRLRKATNLGWGKLKREQVEPIAEFEHSLHGFHKPWELWDCWDLIDYDQCREQVSESRIIGIYYPERGSSGNSTFIDDFKWGEPPYSLDLIVFKHYRCSHCESPQKGLVVGERIETYVLLYCDCAETLAPPDGTQWMEPDFYEEPPAPPIDGCDY